MGGGRLLADQDIRQHRNSGVEVSGPKLSYTQVRFGTVREQVQSPPSIVFRDHSPGPAQPARSPAPTPAITQR